MKTLTMIAITLQLAAIGWSQPQPQPEPSPSPSAQQVVQNTSDNRVRVELQERKPGMRLVKAAPAKPAKKPAEIKFRDFRTARDAYPAD